MDARPDLYLGAAVNPFVPPFEQRALRLLKKQKAGVETCIKLVETVKTLTGVAGIHVMAYNWESSVSEIIEATGLSKTARNV